MSRAKMFGGTVVRPNAILASSSASSLYLRGTWLSSRRVAVCLHLRIVTARLLHYLVDDKLRVTAHIEAFDAEIDGDAKATEESLVLRHII